MYVKFCKDEKFSQAEVSFQTALAFARSQKKAKKIFQLLKGFYNIVANVRLAHSCSDRCFGSEVQKYEI